MPPMDKENDVENRWKQIGAAIDAPISIYWNRCWKVLKHNNSENRILWISRHVKSENSNLSEKQNKLELLWTNPNPTSDFAAQTLSIDLSNYDGVVIESARNDNAYFTRTAIQKGYRSHLYVVWAEATGFGANARPCRVEEASIVFDDASAYEYNGIGHGIASNTMQIPLKIYGYVN